MSKPTKLKLYYISVVRLISNSVNETQNWLISMNEWVMGGIKKYSAKFQTRIHGS